MLATVSPVMVGAEAASPQPTKPLSASMRTRTLSARATVSPAICTGFFIGRLIAIGSIALIFTTSLARWRMRGSGGDGSGQPRRARQAARAGGADSGPPLGRPIALSAAACTLRHSYAGHWGRKFVLWPTGFDTQSPASFKQLARRTSDSSDRSSDDAC